MIFRKGELFSGPGGLSLGAQQVVVTDRNGERHSIRHEWANDIDPWACETFRANICPDHPDSVYCGDVKELVIEDLPPIDAFAFGFPCNDYSNVGEKRGLDGEYGPLYWHGVKVINHHNPLFFVAENVSGLQSANDGNAFLNILNDLTNAGEHGYVLTPHLYKFEEYGIPQKRHRIIIVGIRKDLNLKFKVPKPTHVDRYATAREALENPPIPEDAPNHEFTKHKQNVIDMLNHIPPGGNAWHEQIPEHLRLNVEKVRMSQIYRRLHPDQPAYTVTGSGGGGTHGYHWEEPRALTNRERARIQTFPDHYVFVGPKEMVRKQIGMAVPPKGAAVIFEAVLRTLAGIDYPSVESKWNYEQMQQMKLEELLQDLEPELVGS